MKDDDKGRLRQHHTYGGWRASLTNDGKTRSYDRRSYSQAQAKLEHLLKDRKERDDVEEEEE